MLAKQKKNTRKIQKNVLFFTINKNYHIMHGNFQVVSECIKINRILTRNR